MRRRLKCWLGIAASLVTASPPAWAEPVVGVDVGATIPTSTFQRTADPGGMIAPFLGYQFGFGTRHFAFTPLLQPALFAFETAVDQDPDSDVTTILAGTAGGRFSLFDEKKEVYLTVQGGYYNDMSGPINDRGEGFNITGGFNYEFWNGTGLGLFIRRDQSSMRAARNSTKDLAFLVAGLSVRHRFVAPPAAPAPAVVQAAPPPPPPPAPAEKRKIVLRGVNFDFDKAVIRPDAEPILDAAAATLKEEGSLVITVAGHTDAVGTDAYNQSLSVRRANAVRDYLARAGVDPKRMTVQGFGESEPVASNDTADGRAQNRRVELRVGE